MTKREFVDCQRSAAQHALDSWRILSEEPDDFLIRDDREFSGEEKVEIVVGEVEESATCFAGIGSCGRGWCKHS
jgi:hypothetical protein